MADHPDITRKDGDPLTPLQMQAAVLEGCGYSKKQIAATLGCSPTSVARWRRDPTYNDEVALFREREVKALESLIHQVKKELADTTLLALQELREMLKAETMEGNPRYSTRLAAIDQIMKNTKLITGSEVKVDQTSSDGSQGPPQAAQIVVAITPDGAITTPPQPRSIDTTAEELKGGPELDAGAGS